MMKSELPILRLELTSVRQKIAELEEKLQLQDFERQITKNSHIMVKSLPPNSPFRRPILFFFGSISGKKDINGLLSDIRIKLLSNNE